MSVVSCATIGAVGPLRSLLTVAVVVVCVSCGSPGGADSSTSGELPLGTVLSSAIHGDEIAVVGTTVGVDLQFEVVRMALDGDLRRSAFPAVSFAALAFDLDGNLLALTQSLTSEEVSILNISPDGAAEVIATFGTDLVPNGSIAAQRDRLLAALYPADGTPGGSALFALPRSGTSPVEVLSGDAAIRGVASLGERWLLLTAFPISAQRSANGQLALTDLASRAPMPVDSPVGLIPTEVVSPPAGDLAAVAGFEAVDRDDTSVWTASSSGQGLVEWQEAFRGTFTHIALGTEDLLVINQRAPGQPASYEVIGLAD